MHRRADVEYKQQLLHYWPKAMVQSSAACNEPKRRGRALRKATSGML